MWEFPPAARTFLLCTTVIEILITVTGTSKRDPEQFEPHQISALFCPNPEPVRVQACSSGDLKYKSSGQRCRLEV